MQPDFVQEPGVVGRPSAETEAERRLPEPLPSELAVPEESPDRSAATPSRAGLRAFAAAAVVAEMLWLSGIAYAFCVLLR